MNTRETSRESEPNHGENKTIAVSKGAVFVNVHQIRRNPYQPRKNFVDEQIRQLAASIKVDGIIQPLLVSQTSKSDFVLIAGERRLRAARLNGMIEVPVVIKESSDRGKLRMALIENIQRADLDPMEIAAGYAALMEDFGMTQEDCAAVVSKDRATISNAIRLLALPQSIQQNVIDRKLSAGHAKAIVSLDEEKKMLQAASIILKRGLNVRQAEQICRNLKTGAEDDQEGHQGCADPNLDYLAENLRSHLRTKVSLRGGGERGKIEISYFSASELERILDLVGLQVR